MAKKPQQRSLTMTYPRLAPYVQIGDYLNSRKEMHHVQLPAYEWDKPRADPEVALISTRRLQKKAEDALATRRKFYKEEKVVLDAEWQDLQRCEAALKQNFSNLSSFIKSNEDKRERAVQRQIEDRRLVEEKSQQIENLQEEIAALQKVKAEFDAEIQKLKNYETYLNSVAGITIEFKNPQDMIDRYESLLKTKRELGERQKQTFTELERAKGITAKLLDDNRFRILGLNTTIAGLNARYQIALTNALHWEGLVWAIKSNALQKYKEITEVKQACRNVYMLMCRRKKETPKSREEEFERQLIYIKKTLQELTAVRTEAEAATKKTFSSMKGETSKVS